MLTFAVMAQGVVGQSAEGRSQEGGFYGTDQRRPGFRLLSFSTCRLMQHCGVSRRSVSLTGAAARPCSSPDEHQGNQKSMDAQLLERAARYGIETQYHDAFGQLRTVAPEVLGRLLGAFAHERPPDQETLPQSVIVRGGGGVRIRPNWGGRVPVSWVILRDGQKIAHGEVRDGEIAVPEHLPNGFFVLCVRAENVSGAYQQQIPLMVSPQQAYQGAEGRRMWALGVQLYSIRSQRNWG